MLKPILLLFLSLLVSVKLPFLNAPIRVLLAIAGLSALLSNIMLFFGLDLLAFMFLIVYMGAVIVLFLFVAMMLIERLFHIDLNNYFFKIVCSSAASAAVGLCAIYSAWPVAVLNYFISRSNLPGATTLRVYLIHIFCDTLAMWDLYTGQTIFFVLIVWILTFALFGALLLTVMLQNFETGMLIFSRYYYTDETGAPNEAHGQKGTPIGLPGQQQPPQNKSNISSPPVIRRQLKILLYDFSIPQAYVWIPERGFWYNAAYYAGRCIVILIMLVGTAVRLLKSGYTYGLEQMVFDAQVAGRALRYDWAIIFGRLTTRIFNWSDNALLRITAVGLWRFIVDDILVAFWYNQFGIYLEIYFYKICRRPWYTKFIYYAVITFVYIIIGLIVAVLPIEDLLCWLADTFLGIEPDTYCSMRYNTCQNKHPAAVFKERLLNDLLVDIPRIKAYKNYPMRASTLDSIIEFAEIVLAEDRLLRDRFFFRFFDLFFYPVRPFDGFPCGWHW